MTPTEIRNLIAKKIEGRGSAIDIGNGLPAILNGLVELVENAVPPALKDIPVIEKLPASPTSISEELHYEIVNSSAIIYDGKLMTLVTDARITTALLSKENGIAAQAFGNVEYDDTGVINAAFVIASYTNNDGDYFLTEYQI